MTCLFFAARLTLYPVHFFGGQVIASYYCRKLLEFMYNALERCGSCISTAATIALTLCLTGAGSGVLAMGGKTPERLSTRRDIQKAKPGVEDIDIWNLPIQDYPLLAKFKSVKQIGLDCSEGTFATDEKLKALAALSLTNVTDIILTNCRLITDKGIRALSKIRSLKGLGLEGTSITDAALKTMASEMQLSGVNVANCDGLTMTGLRTLATSKTLKEISFSADKLTQDEVLEPINLFRNITWCGIVDPHNKLDVKTIKEKGVEKNIRIVVMKTGALQDTYGKGDDIDK